ncbi:hypothetical protein T492DRAFT_866880 [Pavlovales sp. CCMP2436]|nr:hypothetical protein T492DRAFT_866880 [Pavlovales sp. CCMP2436]
MSCMFAAFLPFVVLAALAFAEAGVGSGGSRLFYHTLQGCCGSEGFEKHLGTDSKAGLWLFFALMVLVQLLSTIIESDDEAPAAAAGGGARPSHLVSEPFDLEADILRERAASA